VSEVRRSHWLNALVWSGFAAISLYSLYGAISTSGGRPIEPLLPISDIYYPHRFFPTARAVIEDHLMSLIAFGCPILLKIIRKAYLPAREH